MPKEKAEKSQEKNSTPKVSTSTRKTSTRSKVAVSNSNSANDSKISAQVEKPSVQKSAVPSKPKETVITRQPVVVIMGHIDHGKSTLLDYIRKSNIVDGEAGGITQHLGAYEVTHKNPSDGKESKITFLDTPGHEAFAGIRSRGASAADIAILVVSAEDGVKPQTLEALKCIKNAELPYIVAINKIDKPNADIERTKINLAENEIYLEGFGGDISFVPISALTGKGVPELLDMILLVAEMGDYKARLDKPATGLIIEAHRDNRKGVSATLLIKDGTLKSGQCVVAEGEYSPVRIFEDWSGARITEGYPGNAVRVIGFTDTPRVGSAFSTVDDKKQAENLASSNRQNKNSSNVAVVAQNKIQTPVNTDKTANTEIAPPVISLIIKADVTGSLEGIKHEIAKLKFPPVIIRIVSEGLGDIGEKDLKMSQGIANTFILGFNVEPDAKARPIIERAPSIGLNYNVSTYKVIYELINFVSATAKALVPKEKILVELGLAKILAVFSKNKDKQIIGGKVQKGTITVGSEVKIIRREAEIGSGKVRELQQQKVRAQEVNEGYEFGALVESKIEIVVGDRLQAFDIVEK